MTDKDQYLKIAIKLGVNPKEVELAHKSYWRFINEKIQEVDLSGGISKEEFDKLKTTFFVKRIGWFFCRYNKQIRNYKKKTNENTESKASPEPCDNNC